MSDARVNEDVNKEEWLKARSKLVTGAKIGAIIGCSPFKSRAQMLKQMRDELRGKWEDLDHLPPIIYGKENEPKAIAEFEFLFDKKVEKASFVVDGIFGATPDGLIGDTDVLEVKCPYGKRSHNHPSFDHVDEHGPLRHYYAQAQLQMQVTKRHTCWFFQWSPNGHLLDVIEYNPDFIAEVRPQCESFLNDLKNLVEYGGTAEGIEDELLELYLARDKIDEGIDELKTQLGVLTNNSYQGKFFNLMTVKRAGSVDWKALAAMKNPTDEEVAKFRKEDSESLQLRRKKLKEESND